MTAAQRTARTFAAQCTEVHRVAVAAATAAEAVAEATANADLTDLTALIAYAGSTALADVDLTYLTALIAEAAAAALANEEAARRNATRAEAARVEARHHADRAWEAVEAADQEAAGPVAIADENDLVARVVAEVVALRTTLEENR
jgi:hypothetical protein